MNFHKTICRYVTLFSLVLTISLGGLLQTSKAVAQVDDNDRAHVVFDINVEKLRDPMAAMDVDVNDIIHAMTERMVSKELAAKVKRIYGAVELPSDMSVLEATASPMGLMGRPMDNEKKVAPYNDKKEEGDYKMSEEEWEKSREKESDKRPTAYRNPGGVKTVHVSTRVRRQPSSGRLPHHQEMEVPVSFFVRVLFTDAAAVEEFKETFGPELGSKTVNGKEYITAGEYGPTNLLMHSPSATSFELGTTNYVTNSDRKVLTDRCKEVWQSTPKHAIRMAGELDSIEPLIVEFTDMIARDAPPMAVGGIKMVRKISAIQMTMDMESENLAMLNIEGKDEAAADEINSVLSGFLMMGKGAFNQMAAQEMQRDVPAAAEMMGGIVSDLQFNKAGKSVSLTIAKPADFEAKMKTIVGQAKAAAKKTEELNRVRQVVIGVLNYESAHQRFPFATHGGQSKDLSWRGRIAPFVEGTRVDTTKSHDDKANAEAATQMPECFGDDGRNATVMFVQPEKIPNKFFDIKDGMSNTIAFIKCPNKSIPWLQPGDLSIDEAVEMVTSLKDDESLVVGFYDGSVFRLRAGITSEQIRPFFTPDGGENIDREIIER